MVTIALLFDIIVKSIIATKTGDYSFFHDYMSIKAIISNLLLLFRGWPFLSMIGINNPTWYLCILIQCYIGFFILLKVVPGKVIPNWVLFFLCSIIALILNEFVFAWISFRGFGCFFLGVAECAFLERPKTRSFLDKPLVAKVSLIASCLVVFLSVFLIVAKENDPLQRYICILALYPSVIYIFHCVVPFESATISLFGAVSFEVYIWHSPLMDLEKLILGSTGLSIVRSYWTMLGFAVTVWIIGFIFYMILEKPINKGLKSIGAL